jgi:hypothetical protein
VDVVAGIQIEGLSDLRMCYRSAMKWLQWTPDRNGIIGAVLAVLVLVGSFAFLVTYFPDFQQRRAGAGFGPDWDCTAQPKGDPICIKKPGR